MSNRNILILANDTTYTYNLRIEIIEQLIDEGYHVTIASKCLFFIDELKEVGCDVLDVDAGRRGTNPINDSILLITYIRIIHKRKPDVVLTFNIKPNVYGGIACQLMRKRYIPNITGLGTSLEFLGRMQRLTIALYRIGIHGSQCVFFQNNDNKQFFIDHKMLSNKHQCIVLPGSGVNLDKFKPLPYPNGDEIDYLFVGRILKEKGIDLYIEAAKKIRKEYPLTKFHICGYCDDSSYIKIIGQAVKAGYVIYHGEQKDMRPFYEMAHCIVHPSYYPEGMSNVLLEAAACARPVITTYRSGCKEIVDNGQSGYTIKVNDVYSLVNLIKLFISHDNEKQCYMGLEGRKKVAREYDKKIVIRQYIDIIATKID